MMSFLHFDSAYQCLWFLLGTFLAWDFLFLAYLVAVALHVCELSDVQFTSRLASVSIRWPHVVNKQSSLRGSDLQNLMKLVEYLDCIAHIFIYQQISHIPQVLPSED